MTTTLKSAVLRITVGSGLTNLCRPLTRSAAVIFMLHRFSDPDRGIRGHDPADLRRMLAYLRRERYQLVALHELLDGFEGKAPGLSHPVAFTIDDGYAEQATLAAPVFAEFDCPVTTFVTTGFLDGASWFWWDQIAYVFARTTVRTISLGLARLSLRYDLANDARRVHAREEFTARCKALSEDEKLEAIAGLAAAADVPLPRLAPDPYAPMTWDQLRAAERLGMSFGPHTVTHPILARASTAQARREIVQSWERLRAEARSPVPIFAYPNGAQEDFGERELALLGEAGMRGAVTSIAGYVTSQRLRDVEGRFVIPRFPLPESMDYLIQQVGGLERLKFLLRGME